MYMQNTMNITKGNRTALGYNNDECGHVNNES